MLLNKIIKRRKKLIVDFKFHLYLLTLSIYSYAELKKYIYVYSKINACIYVWILKYSILERYVKKMLSTYFFQ